MSTLRGIVSCSVAGFLTSITVAAVAALASGFDFTPSGIGFASLTKSGSTWIAKPSILTELHGPFPHAESLATSFESRINPAWANRPQRSTVIRTDGHCYAFHGIGLDHVQVGYLDIGNQVSAGMYMVSEVRAGWPKRCLTGVSRGLRKSQPEFLAGIGVPPELRREAALYKRFIPISPLPGLAVNTAFYAGLYFFAAFAMKATIRRRRVPRNLCPSCGYQRTGLAPDSPCPECSSPSAGTK